MQGFAILANVGSSNIAWLDNVQSRIRTSKESLTGVPFSYDSPKMDMQVDSMTGCTKAHGARLRVIFIL
jgi:hypothetical protein